MPALYPLLSIHAPRAGCDRSMNGQSNGLQRFQSTHPVRGATIISFRFCKYVFSFQSTHPVRGATKAPAYCFSPVIIFQSTHPVRGATYALCDIGTSIAKFQSTHPVRGATLGCPRRSLAARRHFNPRTPCGVRRSCMVRLPLDLQISIHAPRAGCDSDPPKNTIIDDTFQSTHPVRGATHAKFQRILVAINFNPRTPCGVRRGSKLID